MFARHHMTRTAALAAGLAFAGSIGAADTVRAGGSPDDTASGIRTVGYSTGDNACVNGNCRVNGTAAHGYRCGCPECSEPSAFERLCLSLKVKKRETLHDHSTWAIDHYRHLHHPKCPPYCHPSWGYYQTCWSRFPEETLWCPECPPGAGTALPLPTPVVTPIGPAVAPPPAPTHLSPAPAPLPEPRNVEEPPYEDAPVGEAPTTEAPAGTTSVFFNDDVVSVGYAAEAGAAQVAPAAPPFLSSSRTESRHPLVETPPHPRNRWRMEQ